MKQALNIFMDLLKSEIANIPINPHRLDLVSADIMPELYNISDKHDLIHVIAVALKKTGVIKRDDTFGKKDNGFVNDTTNNFVLGLYYALDRYENMKYEEEQIKSLFEKENITFVLLKGSSIGKYYHEPWLRLSSDIDILVHAEDVERAKEVLISKLNYKVRKYNYHDICMYSQQGFHLELHFQILENEKKIDGLLEKVWDYVHPLKEGMCQSVMSNEYMMFYIYAHMYYHFLHGGCGIRYFADVWVLENNMDYNRTEVERMCTTCGISTFVFYVNKLTKIWFENEEHENVTRKMEAYVLAGGVFGDLNSKVLVGKTKARGRMGYLWQRIFIPYNELKISKSRLDKYPVLYPIYLVMRWCKVFDKNISRKAYDEIILNQNINQTEVNELKHLFDELKL
ncbi:MAG: nucleotidyltransferase family protein [Tyzzerella sp.]|nr:nucleotidyltransferase family protein [Tyzzerella sp.]